MLSVLFSLAAAAEIEVDLDRPTVMFYVDRRNHAVDLGGRTVRVKDLSPGEHVLEIRNMMGKTLTTLDITLAPDEKVWVDLKKRDLVVAKRVSLSTGDAARDPQSVPPAEGSLAFGGAALDPAAMHVLVGGRPLTWSAERSAFVRWSLPTGPHRYQLFAEDALLTEGTVEVRPGRHSSCQVTKALAGYVANCSSDREAWVRPTPPQEAPAPEADAG